jgi:Zn-dependent protease
MIWVAGAGPAVNILLAAVSALLTYAAVFLPDFARRWAMLNLANSMLINIVLAVFNMIPLPPLDGGRVAVGLLPRSLGRPLARAERYGMLILIGVLFILPMLGRYVGTDLNVLAWILEWPAEKIYDVVSWLTGTHLLD